MSPKNMAVFWEGFARKRARLFTRALSGLSLERSLSHGLRRSAFAPVMHTLSFAALVLLTLFSSGVTLTPLSTAAILGTPLLVSTFGGYLRFYMPGRVQAFKSGLLPSFIEDTTNSFKTLRGTHWTRPSKAGQEEQTINQALIAASLLCDNLLRSYHDWVCALDPSAQDELRELINRNFKLRLNPSDRQVQVFDSLMAVIKQFQEQASIIEELKSTLEDNLKARQDLEQSLKNEPPRVVNLDLKDFNLDELESFPPLPSRLETLALKSQVLDISDVTAARIAAREELSNLLNPSGETVG